MSYATTANRPNPLAAFGALGVPAAFGAVLVLGLAVNVTISDEDTSTIGVFLPEVEDIEPVPPPEPLPEVEPVQDRVPQPVPQYTPAPMPRAEIDLGNSGPIAVSGPADGDWVNQLPMPQIEIPNAGSTPIFDAISARPRGNPGRWITDADYRPSWINRGFSGVARFSLTIDASGRVSDCNITGSTGYAQLDEATCRLLERRARFDPAKDSSGKTVAGKYSSSVRWSIPD